MASRLFPSNPTGTGRIPRSPPVYLRLPAHFRFNLRHEYLSVTFFMRQREPNRLPMNANCLPEHVWLTPKGQIRLTPKGQISLTPMTCVVRFDHHYIVYGWFYLCGGEFGACCPCAYSFLGEHDPLGPAGVNGGCYAKPGSAMLVPSPGIDIAVPHAHGVHRACGHARPAAPYVLIANVYGDSSRSRLGIARTRSSNTTCVSRLDQRVFLGACRAYK